MQKKFHLPKFNLEVEVNKFARQADGSAWIRCGNNIVLATAVASKEPKEFAGFLPLTVEYRERTSAAGHPSGGFFKREGKLSDAEVLASRLIDRPIISFLMIFIMRFRLFQLFTLPMENFLQTFLV